MENFLFQSGISTACFYVLYRAFVRFRGDFNFNRFFILSSVFLSIIIPLLDFGILGFSEINFAPKLDSIIIDSAQKGAFRGIANNQISIFSIVYIVGLLVFAIRSLAGLATLAIMYGRSEKKKFHGFTAIFLSKKQSPFTFFNLLFINPSDSRHGKIDELITHEKVHRDYGHSFDLILFEIFTIIHWFNPFAWLFRFDLKSEHEFLADEQVIKKGFDKTAYQALLLLSHEGLALYLANNFNYSILKKRLVMMKKQKSKGIKYNYIFALPALLLTASALFVNFKINEQAYLIPDVMPEYLQGEEAFYGTFQKAITYPAEARRKNEQGTVYVSFTITKEGVVADIQAGEKKYNMLKEVVVVGYSDKEAGTEINKNLNLLQKESERVTALLGKFKPGTENEAAVETRVTLPITFKLQGK